MSGKNWNVKVNYNQRCAFGVTLTALGHMQLGEWEQARSCLKTVIDYINDGLEETKK